jgi:PTS system nitrogen regulatory IIA component
MPLSVELSAVLDASRVLILESSTKNDTLEALIDCLSTASEIKNPKELYDAIFYREQLMSTGIGMGIGVPHVRLNSVEKPVMCVGICRKPIMDYESLDGQPVRLIFMIAAGKEQHAQYLRLLSSLSSKLKNVQLYDALVNAPNGEEFYRILVQEDI